MTTRPGPKTVIGGSLRRCYAAALAMAAVALNCPDANASFEFARFDQVSQNQPFTFTNNGGTSATIAVDAAPITFSFTAASGLPTTGHLASLTITNSPPFPPGTPSTFTPASALGGFLDQPISNVTTLSITEDGTGKNLLTMLFTGDIVGRNGGSGADIMGEDTTGQVVAFTSDFGTFLQPGNSYDLGLMTISPTLSIGPGGFLNGFTSNISGHFSANFTPKAVPEPSSAVLMGIGLVGGAWLVRTGRRAGA